MSDEQILERAEEAVKRGATELHTLSVASITSCRMTGT